MSILAGLKSAFSRGSTEAVSSSATAAEDSTPDAPAVVKTDIFLARQPIFDRKQEVFGYELLYRDSDTDRANITDDHDATRSTLMNALVELGLTELVGKHQAFVNLGPDFIFGGFPFTEYKDRLILEVLETIPIDMPLIRAVRNLKEQGFRIALDDVSVRPEVELLFPVADIVKLDLTLIPPEELGKQISTIRKHPHLTVLAEKVEDPDVFRRCYDRGCDYFQGYFFARPTVVKGSRLTESRLSVLQLIAKLQNPAVSVIEIEGLIKQDATLSYKILRYINSAITGIAHEITSVRQAITLLGINRIRVLATMLGLANGSQKPLELLVTALVRARTCELIGQRLKLSDPSSLFVVGLFSLLDAMLDQPLSVIIKDLPLSEPIRDAITKHDGPMGQILEKVLQFERGDWSGQDADPIAAKMRESYLEAIRWTSAWQPDLFFKN